MLKDYDDYAKYIEFMESYEDELYVLCTEFPEKWEMIKKKLINNQYDVESNDRIFLTCMESTEFYVKVNDNEEYITNHPLLRELAEIEIEDDDADE